jgi:AraC-like DNA-binding protein
MGINKIFHDEILAIKKSATFLLISPHQLSEFLNNDLKTNLNSFINSLRIQDAKKIIQSEENVSILYSAF